MNTSNIVFIALSPLLVWRMYARARRLVGRQRLSAPRHWISTCIYSALLSLLAWLAWPALNVLAALGGGVAFGAALALFGLRVTQFERAPLGLFYTPNAHIGIALSILFAARILYRLVELFALHHAPHGTAADFVKSPATLAIFGTLAGYFIVYAIGLLRWRRQQKRLS